MGALLATGALPTGGTFPDAGTFLARCKCSRCPTDAVGAGLQEQCWAGPSQGWGHPWVLTAAPPLLQALFAPPQAGAGSVRVSGQEPTGAERQDGGHAGGTNWGPPAGILWGIRAGPPCVGGVGGAATLSPPALGAGPAEEVVAGAEQHGAQGLRPQQHPGAAGARGWLEPGGSPPGPPRASSTPTAPGGGVQGSPHHPLSLCPPSQVSPPNLHMGSSPAEVTAWLKDKGFSRMCAAPRVPRAWPPLGGVTPPG